MLHIAMSKESSDFIRFNQEHNKEMLKEATGIMNVKGETRYLKNCTLGFLLNQIPAKAGIEKHSRKAAKSLLKQFIQLENVSTFISADTKRLTLEEKKRALHIAPIIKEKQDSSMKERASANRIK